MKKENKNKHKTLTELKDERRGLAALLLKEDASLNDAQRFRSVCGEILYMEETITTAKHWNAGKITCQQLGRNP